MQKAKGREVYIVCYLLSKKGRVVIILNMYIFAYNF